MFAERDAAACIRMRPQKTAVAVAHCKAGNGSIKLNGEQNDCSRGLAQVDTAAGIPSPTPVGCGTMLSMLVSEACKFGLLETPV
eukprot:322561-Chlamydomonas_euryale.AAC.17